jgi:hypothetical protein
MLGDTLRDSSGGIKSNAVGIRTRHDFGVTSRDGDGGSVTAWSVQARYYAAVSNEVAHGRARPVRYKWRS